MTAGSDIAPLAIAMSVLVLLTAIGIVAIPLLDALLAREIARRHGVGQPRNDNDPKEVHRV